MIDEDAGELVADRLVEQHGGDRGIDAAREAADHAALADLARGSARSPARGRRPWSSRRRSRRCGARNCASSLRAVRRVHDLGVELHAVDSGARRRRWRRRARRRSSPTDAEARRHARSTRSPWLIQTCSRSPLAPDAVEQRAVAGHLDEGAAELAVVGALDLAAELRAHRLLAVADAEHRHAQLEDDLPARAALALVHRGRAAREDDALGRRIRAMRCGVDVERAGSRNRRRSRARAGRSAG